jgi:subtilisin family serine protease
MNHVTPPLSRSRASRVALAAGMVLLAACADEPVGPSPAADDLSPVFGAGPQDADYVVVLEGSALPEEASEVAAAVGARPRFVYTSALVGFAATLNHGQLEALRRNPHVDYIEADQEYTADLTQNMNSAGDPWGLDRIDQRNRPLSLTYTYANTASSVYVYVIDTGIDAAHSEFEGRATNVYDAFGGSGNDCHGHGTHVAGTIGGKTWGVAKKANLRGLRVLSCSGSGSTSGIIAALDWLRANRTNPAVANMSLGGGFSSALNTAVNNLANSGVFVAVAAGNENMNACNRSPASASAAFTTAASTKTDARASYSNHGSCVDGYAPGSSIRSAWIGSGTTESAILSGTSMASPHVAGVAALYKGANGNASSATIDSWIKNNASTGKISNNRRGTPNRLLYKAAL